MTGQPRLDLGPARELGKAAPPTITREARPFRLPEPDVLVRLYDATGRETCTLIHYGTGSRADRLIPALLRRLDRGPNAVRIEPSGHGLAVLDPRDGALLAFIGAGLAQDQAEQALRDLGREDLL